MLEIDTDVIKGIVVIKLNGVLNRKTICEFDREINYLFYKQGFNYYVFDFNNIERIEFDIFNWLENKLMEIFLSCGKIVLCGLNGKNEGRNYKFDKFSSIRRESQNFDYITI